MNASEFLEVLPLVAPLLLIWLVMLIAGLVDLVRRDRTRGPKWAWFLVVIFFSILGPTVYFLLGRDDA